MQGFNLSSFYRLLSAFFLLFLCYSCGMQDPDSSDATQSTCPDQPLLPLKEKAIEKILLTEETIVSGRVRASENIGYQFQAKEGQKILLKSKQDICIWVYTPKSTLLDNSIVPEDGSYLIQVSTLKGVKTFELKIGLESLENISSKTKKSEKESDLNKINSSGEEISDSNDNNTKEEQYSDNNQSTFDAKAVYNGINQGDVFFTSKNGDNFVGKITKSEIRERQSLKESGVAASISWNDGVVSSILLMEDFKVRVWEEGIEYSGSWYWNTENNLLNVRMDKGSKYQFGK